MYKEIYIFSRSLASRKAVWTDGELWTATVCGIAFGILVYFSPDTIEGLRKHFSEMLTLLSLFFGFALASLALYFGFLPSSANSTPDAPQNALSLRKLLLRRVVEGYIQTIFTLLVCIVWVILLWAFGDNVRIRNHHLAFQYGVLAFLLIYPICQIINHATTIWWTVTKLPFTSNHIVGTSKTYDNSPNLTLSAYEKTLAPSIIGLCCISFSLLLVLSFNLSWLIWLVVPASLFFLTQCIVFCIVGFAGFMAAFAEGSSDSPQANLEAGPEQSDNDDSGSNLTR